MLRASSTTSSHWGWYVPAMIRSIELENFRAHEATKIPLEQFTLLVGDNGAGKSSALEALAFVDFVLGKGTTSLLDYTELLRSRGGPMMAIRLKGDSPKGDWHLDLWAVTKTDLRFSWKLGDGGEYEVKADGLGGNSGGTNSYVDFPQPEIARHVNASHILQMSVAELQAPSVSNEEQPIIGWDGSGLATALLYLKANDHRQFLRFQDAAIRVIPNLEEITFERVKQERKRVEIVRVENELVELPRTEPYMADRLRLRFAGTDPLPAHLASEGTLYAIGLLASLHMPNAPQLMLIDDLDKGLHPRAQAALVRMIREILIARPETQIIATSHSPYLVDSFSREEVVVLSRTIGMGRIQARKLSEHPDAGVVKTLSTGEFLNSSGSDWFGL